jgi:hypothetical protein
VVAFYCAEGPSPVHFEYYSSYSAFKPMGPEAQERYFE